MTYFKQDSDFFLKLIRSHNTVLTCEEKDENWSLLNKNSRLEAAELKVKRLNSRLDVTPLNDYLKKKQHFLQLLGGKKLENIFRDTRFPSDLI